MDIPGTENFQKVLSWLLSGDPAIRYQTLRDLAGADEKAVQRERGAIASSGWGKRLLDLQDPEGTWAGGLYSPKWTSTTYTLLQLRDFGMEANAAVARACGMLLEKGFCPDEGINLAKGSRQSETCLTGMVLSLSSRFGLEDERIHRIAKHLLSEQMPDGGWNCLQPQGAVHGSFHTTIIALEGLRDYRTRFRPTDRKWARSQQRGMEFLLQHRLFKSHRTGKIVDERMTRFSFPPRWHYDVLRGLDYAQSVGSAWDGRFEDAVRLLESRRMRDGRWPLQNRHPGRTFFEMEKPGKPSRWNTLRCLRVLKWRDQKHGR